MQQSRQLDPSLLVKQQTPPSQQQPLHQPAMKSFLENVMPHTTPELQKGPSPINAFSNFPIGGFLVGLSIQLMLGATGFYCVVFPSGRGLSHWEKHASPGVCSLSKSCLGSCGFSWHSCFTRPVSVQESDTAFKTSCSLEWVRIKMKLLSSFLVEQNGKGSQKLYARDTLSHAAV